MQKLIFTTLFSFCLSALVSGWVTYLNLGIDAEFVPHWFSAFLHAWPVALITAYLLSGPVQTLTHCILEVFNDT
ncbi:MULTISPECIES: DUF2798 domain-containing protein [unclassified Pseudoalteromonas]|uniref:DUF2798 domain-containing protein n=1 Tax=unclassified Pseudoalteromonas TaxID=194690 RepID=UPI002097F82F|nr:DUF2798 domain-containing protein [Pseudoalteromonas sp. XMcav2-N]MCO7189393.1 DUF2798 domain-containing protein [Pseudoalteromonas sp. XMcav2-N]